MRSKFDFLLDKLTRCDAWYSGIHGHDHWMRVVENGLDIANHTPGVDKTVVELFGLLHDTQRWGDGEDRYHGPRAAEFLDKIVNELHITEKQYELLRYAIEHHTDELHNSDPTIGACYDSDRLDLGRVGKAPNPDYLNTNYAKSLAPYAFIDEVDE